MNAESSRKQRSHERIVDAASRAIRRVGLDGVGVAGIMKEAGLTHGGFYAHFESKDALLVHAMHRAGADAADGLEVRVELRRSRGEDGYSALVNAYLDDDQLTNVERGCEIAALASEMSRETGEVRAEARRQLRALIRRVALALRIAPDDERARADTASLVGALQLARVLGDKEGRMVLSNARAELLSRRREHLQPGTGETRGASAVPHTTGVFN